MKAALVPQSLAIFDKHTSGIFSTSAFHLSGRTKDSAHHPEPEEGWREGGRGEVQLLPKQS